MTDGHRRRSGRFHGRISHRHWRAGWVFRKIQSGQGQRIDVDLLSSMMHLYIQEYAVFLNGGPPQRSNSDIPSAYLGAPYGYFETRDGYIAIPMNPINKVAELIGVDGYATSLRVR